MLIDRDASVIGAADSSAHVRRIAATTNDRNRGYLGDEDTIEPEFAATECEPDDCGTFSINVLASASTTPSTGVCWVAAGQGDPGTVQSQLDPCSSDRRRCCTTPRRTR